MLALVAEAAAHVARHDTQLAFAQAELFADVAADVVLRLRAAVQGFAGCDGAACLDRSATEPIVHQLELHATRCTGKRGFYSRTVAPLPSKGLVVVDERQRLVIYLDLLGRVFSRRA